MLLLLRFSYVFYAFFQNPKSRDFTIFCRVAYVFSNYGQHIIIIIIIIIIINEQINAAFSKKNYKDT